MRPTLEQFHEAARLRKEGIPTQEIALRLGGIAKSTLRRWAAGDCKPPPPPKAVKPAPAPVPAVERHHDTRTVVSADIVASALTAAGAAAYAELVAAQRKYPRWEDLPLYRELRARFHTTRDGERRLVLLRFLLEEIQRLRVDRDSRL